MRGSEILGVNTLTNVLHEGWILLLKMFPSLDKFLLGLCDIIVN